MIKIDGLPEQTIEDVGPDYAGTISISGLADGAHTLSITASDVAGNQDSFSCSFIVNKLPPYECFQGCIGGGN